VIALVSRLSGGSRSEAQKLPQNVAPPTPALLAASEYARARGLAIEPQAVWSDNPPINIITAARAAEVA
jgi:hypothetical protein